MSRTTTNIRGKEYPKSKKTSRITPKKDMPKAKFKKHFGFTSGTHSQWEQSKKYLKAQYNDLPEDHPMRPLIKKRLDAMGAYPVKGKDYVKYGYGKGTVKAKRVKNYKKEIE